MSEKVCNTVMLTDFEHQALVEKARMADDLAEALSKVIKYRKGEGEFDPSGIPEDSLENFRHDMWQGVEAQILEALANYCKSKGER